MTGLDDNTQPDDDEMLLDTPIDGGGDAHEPDDAPDDDGEEEAFVGFGDTPIEAAEEVETPTIRRLREENKRLAKLAKAAPAQQQEVPKRYDPPSLESCDYDGDKHAAALIKWRDNERAVTAAEQKQAQATAQQQQTLTRYRERSRSLPVKDFDAAHEVVAAALPIEAQNAILAFAEAPEVVVYYLGKDAKALDDFSALDPVQQIKRIGYLEGKGLKVGTQRKAPPPEKVASGGAPAGASGWKKRLAEAEAKADKTGDRTEYQALRRKAKEAGHAE